MRVRNQNLKTSRIQTIATDSPVKNSTSHIFKQTTKENIGNSRRHGSQKLKLINIKDSVSNN